MVHLLHCFYLFIWCRRPCPLVFIALVGVMLLADVPEFLHLIH